MKNIIIAIFLLLSAPVCMASQDNQQNGRTAASEFSLKNPEFAHKIPFAKAHIVMQISSGDPAHWNLALNTMQNLLNFFGIDKVQIVAVTFGPGEKMLFKNSKMAERVSSLDKEGVEFDACGNTYKELTKKLGHAPELNPQAIMVPAGIVRIMQLQEDKFNYVNP